MDVKQYLKRFGAESFTDISLSNLTKLQELHMQHIPFENLDVIRRVPIYLNLQTIYDKIVGHNRGGYCYEVNGLFHWLLIELGYTAHFVPATVKRPNGIWAKEHTHVALIVKLDVPYLLDVGFGAATPRVPIPLDGSIQQDISSFYRIERLADDSLDLIQKNEVGERILYRFTLDYKNLPDFHEGCVFNQVSEGSSFTHFDIITRSTPTGRITLTNNELSITDNSVETSITVTDKEKESILSNYFKIVL
ncbi:arylamine N-acetyltransferase family protein [Sporosarcina sp. CAU 1771]